MEINTEKLYKDIEFKSIYSFEYHKYYKELETLDPEAFEKIQNSYQNSYQADTEDIEDIEDIYEYGYVPEKRLILKRSPMECNVVYTVILKNYKNSFFSVKTLKEKIEYKNYEAGTWFKIAFSRIEKILNDLEEIGLIAVLPLNQNEKIYKVHGSKSSTLNIDNPEEVKQKIVELKTWYYCEKIKEVPDLYEVINVLCSKHLAINDMDANDFSQKIIEFGKKIQGVITLKLHEGMFLYKNYKHFENNNTNKCRITLNITEKLIGPPQKLLKKMVNRTNFSAAFKRMEYQKLYVTKPLRLEGFNHEEWGQIFDMLDVKLEMIASRAKW